MFARPPGKGHIINFTYYFIVLPKVFMGEIDFYNFIFLMDPSRSIFYLNAFFLELTLSTIIIFVSHSTASLITRIMILLITVFFNVDITNRVQ